MAHTPAATLQAGALTLLNPAYIIVKPWTSETVLGTDTYELVNVLRDSTSISQDDNTENNIENELSNTPIAQSIILGNVNFSTTLIDQQDTIMGMLAGWSIDATSGDSAMMSTYTPVWAQIDLVFKKGANSYSAIILPKVQLNTKITVESLSSNATQTVLSGTGMTAAFTIGASTSVNTSLVIDASYTLPS